jgi:hypothetical protein
VASLFRADTQEIVYQGLPIYKGLNAWKLPKSMLHLLAPEVAAADPYDPSSSSSSTEKAAARQRRLLQALPNIVQLQATFVEPGTSQQLVEMPSAEVDMPPIALEFQRPSCLELRAPVRQHPAMAAPVVALCCEAGLSLTIVPTDEGSEGVHDFDDGAAGGAKKRKNKAKKTAAGSSFSPSLSSSTSSPSVELVDGDLRVCGLSEVLRYVAGLASQQPPESFGAFHCDALSAIEAPTDDDDVEEDEESLIRGRDR